MPEMEPWYRNLIRKPLFQFLAGSILTLLGTVATIWFGVFPRPIASARLEARLIFEQDALGFATALQLPVHIVWDASVGVEQHEIDLNTLKVAYIDLYNAGDEPLDWDRDVKSPVTLTIAGKGKIFYVANTKKRESDELLGSHIVQTPESCTISTSFLNPHTSLLLTVVHSGDERSLRMGGRIIGQDGLFLQYVNDSAGVTVPSWLIWIVPAETFVILAIMLLPLYRSAFLHGTRYWVGKYLLSLVICAMATLVAFYAVILIFAATYHHVGVINTEITVLALTLLVTVPFITLLLMYVYIKFLLLDGSQVLGVVFGKKRTRRKKLTMLANQPPQS